MARHGKKAKGSDGKRDPILPPGMFQEGNGVYENKGQQNNAVGSMRENSLMDKIVQEEFNRLKDAGLFPNDSIFAQTINSKQFAFVLKSMQLNIMECQARIKDLFIKSQGGYVGLVGKEEVKK